MLKRDHIQVNRGKVVDRQLDRRDGNQRGERFIIAPALRAGRGARLLLAFDMQIAELLVVATTTERAQQPIERPFRSA